MDLRNRTTNTKSIKRRVLIVCEGARTEPDYFRSFKVFKNCNVVGSGSNTISVVKRALQLMSKEKYAEAWCVFDRDSFPKANIKKALALATQNNIKVAFSNESFELWYVLHYEYLDTKITRRDYCSKLTRILKTEYQKNNPGMYRILQANQLQAIQNAKRLEKSVLLPGYCSVDAYPYTTVYKLVERLNKLATKAAFKGD